MTYQILNSLITAAQGHINNGECLKARALVNEYKVMRKHSENTLSQPEIEQLNLQMEPVEKTISVFERSGLENIFAKVPPPISALQEKADKSWTKSHLVIVSIVGLIALYFFPFSTSFILLAGITYKIFSQCIKAKPPIKALSSTNNVETKPNLPIKLPSTVKREEIIPVKEEKRENSLAKAPVQKVVLREASQYTIEGNRPAACTFHAIKAATEIAFHFDEFARSIAQNKSEKLSQWIRNILTKGLIFYNDALKQNPFFIEGADIDQVRKLPKAILPKGMNIQEKDVRVVHSAALKLELTPLFDYLFKAQPSSVNAVIMKNSNDETFALICKGDQVIIFDSHKNEIVLTCGRNAVEDQLCMKLQPYVGDMNTVEYAFAVVLNT